MSEKDNATKSVFSRVLPDDIIASMLAKLPGKEVPADPCVIHGTVKSLKDEFPELLKWFVFSESKARPFSKILERVLFRLECSGVIQGLNPTYAGYRYNMKLDLLVFFTTLDMGRFPIFQKATFLR